jgi:hypothetical protein
MGFIRKLSHVTFVEIFRIFLFNIFLKNENFENLISFFNLLGFILKFCSELTHFLNFLKFQKLKNICDVIFARPPKILQYRQKKQFAENFISLCHRNMTIKIFSSTCHNSRQVVFFFRKLQSLSDVEEVDKSV